MINSRVLSIVFGILFPLVLMGQQQLMVVENIELEGNKKTRTPFILRELDFKAGDTLHLKTLADRLEKNRLWLMSTGLFSQLTIEQKDSTTIKLTMKEAWYIYPYIQVALGDRNFNIWWNEQGRDLGRLNYVFRVSHRNITGRRDLLDSYIQLGYEPKFQLTYDIPFFNRSKTLGLRYDIFYAQAKEVGYNTIENILEFANNEDEVMIQRLRTSAKLRYQPKIYTRHGLEVFYHQNEISNFVADLNPNFFINGTTNQRYFAAVYEFINDRRDFRPYPIKGNYLEAQVMKEGFGIFDDLNTLHLSGIFAQYFPLSKKISLELVARGRYYLSEQTPPYFNLKALGYRANYLRGYEYYVIDGTDYAVGQATIRYELVNKEYDLAKILPFKSYTPFPLRIYAKVFHDEGYVNNPTPNIYGNTFTNSWLWSAGTGVDFVIYNDFVVQLEYTWNKTGENDLYLHFKLPF